MIDRPTSPGCPPTGDDKSTAVSWRSWLIVAAVATGLSILFWAPLYQGGGLIGGDIYTYFFPQKAFLADQLAAGELPLWNNRVGHGYPLVGESQTGLFYPFHLLYAVLDVNTAYNTVQLLHYILAFLFTWRYVRQLGPGDTAGVLAAIVYVYGWFPPRICLEWAILGGTWLPLALWMAEQFLTDRRRRDLAILAVTLALQLLAGHFHLAFITQLVVATYVPGRLWLARQGLPETSVASRFRLLTATGLTLVLAFGLAAVQLVPTWELKQASQRDNVSGRKYDPGYGHLPFAYWTQVVAPWKWYDAGFDHVSQIDAGPADTNQVEAHLYFGLPTIGLLLVAGLAWLRQRQIDSRLMLWCGLGALALAYTPAWHLPITRHLPGFGFFTGPGRYSIVTTLSVAVLSAAAWQWLTTRSLLVRRGGIALLVTASFFPLLTWDLWEVSRKQTYAVFMQRSLIDRVDASPVTARLRSITGQPVRLFCDYQNLPTLMGVASTPVYLGLGPAEYFDESLAMPEPLPFERTATPEQIDWLQRAGVTHILSRHPLDTAAWPVKLIERTFDPDFLQVAYHGGDVPLEFHLYELLGSRGRLAWLVPEKSAAADRQPAVLPRTARITSYTANRITARVESAAGGRLVLTDLVYPGWKVSIDGKPAETIRVDGMYRGVDVTAGGHDLAWTYAPSSIRIGAVISLVSLVLFVTLSLVRRGRFGLACDKS
ncbi:MAG: YfhO family protein [Planctomycetaceae bacterium]